MEIKSSSHGFSDEFKLLQCKFTSKKISFDKYLCRPSALTKIIDYINTENNSELLKELSLYIADDDNPKLISLHDKLMKLIKPTHKSLMITLKSNDSKTENDKATQNKNVMKYLSGQTEYLFHDVFMQTDIIEKLSHYFAEMKYSNNTITKYLESLINYCTRANVDPDAVSLLKAYKVAMLHTIKDEIITADNLLSDKIEKDYTHLLTDKTATKRNRIFALIKVHNLKAITGVILSDTKLNNYTEEETHIDLDKGIWVIYTTRYKEIALSPEFITELREIMGIIHKHTYLINDKSDTRVSSTAVSNEINRYFKKI